MMRRRWIFFPIAVLLAFLIYIFPASGQVSQPLKVTDTVTPVYPTYTLQFPSGTITKSGTTAIYTAAGGSGTVTSISQGTGITNTPNPITTTGTVAVNQAFSPTWTGNHTWSPGGTALVDFGVSVPQYIALAANTGIVAANGAGEISLSGMTGNIDLPTGNFEWTGAVGSSYVVQAGTTIDIDGGSSIEIGRVTATSVDIGRNGQSIGLKGITTLATGLTFLAGANTLIFGDKLQAPQLSGTVPVASLTGSTALAGAWTGVMFGTIAATTNFTGPYRTVANIGIFRNITCSVGTAGTTGSTNMTGQIWNVTDNASHCTCTLGACNTAAGVALACDCNTAFVAAKSYAVRLSAIGDCATPAQNMVCNVELQM